MNKKFLRLPKVIDRDANPNWTVTFITNADYQRGFVDRIVQRYLTTEQAAEYLGQSPRTLQDWRCDKIGPPFIVMGPRNIKYDVRDLDTWADERR